jgi:photosynthetic reaction center cytochrome c subunit
MRSAILGLVSGVLLFAGLACAPASSIAQTSQPPAKPPASTPPAQGEMKPAPMPAHEHEEMKKPADDFDSQKALDELKKSIAGKEDKPAEEVFMNIKTFKGVPAARLLGAMNGFSNALGVTCRQCHDVSNWASDDKHEKEAARGMLAMTKDINAKYLPTMQGIDTDASVNCNTCHRGHAHPGEGMRPPGGGGSKH